MEAFFYLEALNDCINYIYGSAALHTHVGTTEFRSRKLVLLIQFRIKTWNKENFKWGSLQVCQASALSHIHIFI